MRVLITGGSGSLGSNIIEHFSEPFEAIHVVDNFATGKRDALPIVDGLTIHEGSVSDIDLMQKVMASCAPDLVIHSATAYKSERIGCIQTLYQHRNVLFANQQRFIPSEASCHRIKAANCRPMIIMCDQRKKKGYCHVID